MDDAREDAPVGPLERSSHRAFIHGNTLYVWGGYRMVGGEDVILPSDEIWFCDLDSGTWDKLQATGDVPSNLAMCSSAHVNGTLYIFGGWLEPDGYSNEMFSIDLSQQPCSWRKVTDTRGPTPSPRNKHSCWAHKNRLIFFGGYGCKTMGDVRSSWSSFIVDEMSWSTIGDTLFRCWGWNSEVVVFDIHSSTWSKPETRGSAPSARGCHASALLGNRGYLSGGVETAELDLFCLDLETWTWTEIVMPPTFAPLGRSMHTMTSISDHALFVFGGLGIDGVTLNDAWKFDTRTNEWTEIMHPHRDKPRVCHTACLGQDSDVVVFGGCSNLCVIMDTIAILRAPSQHHCSDILIFQTQPYSLSRLCEDFIGEHQQLFGDLLSLPSKLRSSVNKRRAFFSTVKPFLKA
ncbi:kelch domain-containing protein 1-like [Salarias fasciatus]|uniref:Kelch domain-containing protein 1-like n=1 Tax=Salarias fasciatus TaxID=181472 RepID=A0A672GZM0_SALFA|nr:kelch domain-containing protein 1-like [Salarias fasciatus]